MAWTLRSLAIVVDVGVDIDRHDDGDDDDDDVDEDVQRRVYVCSLQEDPPAGQDVRIRLVHLLPRERVWVRHTSPCFSFVADSIASHLRVFVSSLVTNIMRPQTVHDDDDDHDGDVYVPSLTHSHGYLHTHAHTYTCICSYA